MAVILQNLCKQQLCIPIWKYRVKHLLLINVYLLSKNEYPSETQLPHHVDIILLRQRLVCLIPTYYIKYLFWFSIPKKNTYWALSVVIPNISYMNEIWPIKPFQKFKSFFKIHAFLPRFWTKYKYFPQNSHDLHFQSLRIANEW